MTPIFKIGRPFITKAFGGKTRLSSLVEFDGLIKEIWVEVDDKYAKYLCTERCDAFLVGLLPFAYRRGYDIFCEAPVHERLIFQLRSYLIPLISMYGRAVHPVKINADTNNDVLGSASAVGTGISCGVDCLHVIKNHLDCDLKGLRLTHLVLNNVGAYGETGSSDQFDWAIKQALRFSAETDLELIITNSNIFDWFVSLGFDFAQNCTYLNAFPVFALQKLWSVFLYGSAGDDFEKYFSLINNDERCGENYDLLLLDCLSIPSLRIYSEGLPYTRIEKMKKLVDDDFAHRYLNVCVQGVGENCGRCPKCIRTLIMLDVLGALDKFDRVFDIEYYKKHRHWYMSCLYRIHLRKLDTLLEEIYDSISNDITFMDKVRALGMMARNLILRFK